MPNLLLPLAVVLLVSGCDDEQIAQHLGGIVRAYCVASPIARMSMRESIERIIAPHQLTLKCYGDPEGLK